MSDYEKEERKLRYQLTALISDYCQPGNYESVLEKLQSDDDDEDFTLEDLQEIVQALQEAYDTLWDELSLEQKDRIVDGAESLLEIRERLDYAIEYFPDEDEAEGMSLYDLHDIDEIVEELTRLADMV